MTKSADIVVIGGGPAGLAAAIAAKNAGARHVIILDREDSPGGILKQCIHPGFGLHRYKQELTGPEYAARFIALADELDIPCMTETTALSISEGLVVTALNASEGQFEIAARAVIIATGCRERPKGALPIAGTRPAGVYTAGTAQKLINIMGYMPGREAVILGSGDIGLIMARRMTLEGATVRAVCELMPYAGGLARNVEQCLNDFDIPLYLSHTVTRLHGGKRLEGVTVAEVGADMLPISSTERFIPCDTLLLSVGLIPENELARDCFVPMDPLTGGAYVDERRETLLPGIFACGNALHVHDLVDFVSDEAEIAGRSAALSLSGGRSSQNPVELKAGEGIRTVIPQRVSGNEQFKLYFRGQNPARDVRVTLYEGSKPLVSKKFLRLAPSEMESLDIPAGLIDGRPSGGLTLAVGEG